jgi:hypothetical protein
MIQEINMKFLRSTEEKKEGTEQTPKKYVKSQENLSMWKEWQMVKVNTKWKNNRRSDTGKPQQITTIVNQFAVPSDIVSDCDRQKRLEGINKKQTKIERNWGKINSSYWLTVI